MDGVVKRGQIRFDIGGRGETKDFILPVWHGVGPGGPWVPLSLCQNEASHAIDRDRCW